MRLPDHVHEWASSENYAAGGPTKIAMAAAEAAEGAQPETANVSAQEHNWAMHPSTQAARFLRYNATLPRQALAVTTARTSTIRSRNFAATDDGVFYAPNDLQEGGATGPSNMATVHFDAVTAHTTDQEGLRVIQLSSEWLAVVDIENTDDLKAHFYYCQSDDWRQNATAPQSSWSSSVLDASVGTTELEATGCMHPDGLKAWLFVHYGSPVSDEICTQFTWNGTSKTGWTETARAYPAWTDDGLQVHAASYGSTLVALRYSQWGDVEMSVSTDDAATWSAVASIGGGDEPLLLEYSTEHGGWIMADDKGRVYLCTGSPATPANWVLQTSSLPGSDFDGGTRSFRSCARVGTMFIFTISAESGSDEADPHWILWTDDFWASYGKVCTMVWSRVERCGRWLAWYGEHNSTNYIGLSFPLDGGLEFEYVST